MESPLVMDAPWELWLPVSMCSVALFATSMAVWFAPHHRSDYGPVPDEDGVRRALAGIAPGQYNLPNVPNLSQLAEPEVRRLFQEGPVGFLTVLPNGLPRVGAGMLRWWIALWIGSALIGCLAASVLPAGAGARPVFQLVAGATWLSHGIGIVQDAVWFGRPWRAVAKQGADAVVFALVAGSIFAWLWPA